MAELTEKQFDDAKSTIEQYREKLSKVKQFDARSFERDLRKIWDLGHQEVKGLIVELSHHGRCEQVAAYYMEHSNAPGVVIEFQRRLAELYGISSYQSSDRVSKQNEYWERAFAELV